MPADLDETFITDFFAKMVEASKARDADQFVELCTEDVVMDDAGAKKTLHGRAAVRELLDSVYRSLPEGFHFEVVGSPFVSTDGTKAAARWRGVYPDSSNGAEPKRDLETAEFYEFREGLLSHWTVMFRDHDWMGRQVL